MAKYNGPKNRLSRREGLDLFGKGHKLRRAGIPPGLHGTNNRRRVSDYGVRLREKQKVKRMYGIMERQFRKYFEIAAANRGSTGETLLRLLEMRLDNVVYRLGFFPTRAMARQWVGHGHVTVDERQVNMPGFGVKVGQIVALDSRAAGLDLIKTRLQNNAIMPPSWLKREATVGKVTGMPTRADIDNGIDEHLIVEYYSR